MSFYQVDSNNLRSMSEQLGELNRKFIAEKENLTSEETSLKSMWEGEANEAFHQAYVRDAGQMDAFSQLIDNYVLVMNNIADRYEAAESKNLTLAGNRTYV